MNDLRFGLEVLTVGFGVVLVTLLLLALILVCFSKFLAPRKKDLVESPSQQVHKDGDEQEMNNGVSEQTAALSNNHEEEHQEEELETIAVEAEPSIRPELVAAIAGIMYAEESKQARPEVIAAISGTLSYLFEAPDSPGELKAQTTSVDNLWAQIARTRLVQLRQEFVLLRRGMLK